MTLFTSRNLKLVSATLGVGSVVALGAVGLAAVPQPAAVPALTSSHMNVGQTSTLTTPPNAPVVSKAQPSIKGPAPLPTEEADAE